jgi:phage terminase large subunit
MPCEITYSFYGANKEAVLCRDPECMVAGPADTGKTLALLWKLDAIASKYPNASIVICRKRLTDTYASVLQTFTKKILRGRTSVRVYGGDKPQWFDYPNGSRIWVAGLDKSGKVLSSEHDVVYVNQAEQISLSDWEYLTTRTTGRAGNVPYNQCIGDCNPAHPSHWIMQRSRRGGSLHRFDSKHRDNPELYDPKTGRLTAAGRRRLDALKRLTGTRLQRLYHGLWAAPEGAIYDVFDETKHKVTAFPVPNMWPRAVGIDPFGAFVAALWIAFDPKAGILNVYREYLEPFGLTVAGHSENIKKLTGAEPIFAWVCGAKSERAWRNEFKAAGLPVIEPPIHEVWLGIDRVYQLLAEFRLVIHDTCPGLLSEIGGYRRVTDSDGTPTEKIERKEDYHLLDALRYVCAHLTQPTERGELVYEPSRIGPDY